MEEVPLSGTWLSMQKALVVLTADSVMKTLIERYPLPTWSSETNLLADLVETIINQQLSEKAGSTIYGRFLALFDHAFPSPNVLLAMSDEKLRACGLSGAKRQYVKNICQAVTDGTIDLTRLNDLTDEEVIRQLTSIKGVGPWTAEMILMFSLQRPDVFSMGDVGLQAAMQRLYGIERGDRAAMERISNAWRPYRSLACRYLWKSLDDK